VCVCVCVRACGRKLHTHHNVICNNVDIKPFKLRFNLYILINLQKIVCYLFKRYELFLILNNISSMPITVAAHELSTFALTLGSSIRIPLKGWISVCAFILEFCV
jgi:hypothetical protein